MTQANYKNSGKTCLNCGEETSGNYCSNCGQSAKTQTITMSNSISNTVSLIADVDSRVIVTLREMLINPGKASLNYVLGKRIRFVHPVKYFIISMGISLLIMQLLQVGGELPKSQLLLPEFINIPDDKKAVLADWIMQYAQFIMLAFLPIYSYFLSLFFGKKRTAGETTASLFYLNANLALLTGLLLLIRLSPNPIVDGIQGVFAIIYAIWSILVFFESRFFAGIWRIALAYISYGISMFVIIVPLLKGYEIWSR